MSDRPTSRRLTRTMAAFALACFAEMAAWSALVLYGYAEGGARLAGLVLLGQLIPCVLLAAPLGALGDRLPRGTALSSAYAIQCLLLIGLAFAFAMHAPIVVVVAAAAAAMVARAATRPIHFAALSELVETPASLVRSYSASDFISGVTLFVGPVAAGLIIERVGFWAVAGSCAVAMLWAAVLTTRLDLPVVEVDRGYESRLDEMLAGIVTVARDHGLLAVTLLGGACTFCMTSLDILGVSFAEAVLHGGASTAGIVVGAAGIGAAVGAAGSSLFLMRARLASPAALGFAAGGLPLLVMTVIGRLPVAVLLLGLCGAGIALTLVATRTLIQRVTDARILARVFAVQESVDALGLGLGAVVAPVFISQFGAAAAYAPLALIVVGVAVIVWPQLRRLDAVAVFIPEVLLVLRRVPFLAGMAPAALERLSREAQWQNVPAGAVVFREGEHAEAFYVVDEGELSVTATGEATAITIGAGEVFGQVAIHGSTLRTATATALQPSRVVRLGRDEFVSAVTGKAQGHAMDGLLSEDPERVRIVAALTRRPQDVDALERHLGVEPGSLQPILDELVTSGILRTSVNYHPSFGGRKRTRSGLLDNL
ncbi:MAG: cyclic nucleotide-binding domain-containing protein [Actinomycetes bacterium]